MVFDRSARRSVHILKLLMEMGAYQEYFPYLSKFLFNYDTVEQEEAAKREFAAEALEINFVNGSRFLGGYLGPQEELAAWVKYQVEAWAHGVRGLGKIPKQHPQSYYAGLGVLLQLEWKYLQRTIPDVGTLMVHIEEALRDKFPPALFGGGGGGDADFRQILDHIVKHGGLGIPDPVCKQKVHTTPPRQTEGNWWDLS